MNKLPYFPFYYLDWLSSSNVQMMTYAEKGLYIDMLCRCYNDGGLPAEDDKLLRLFHCDIEVLTVVKKQFYEKNKLLKNKKLDSVINAQRKIQKAKVDAGKASAKARRAKRLESATDVQQPLNSVATESQQNLTNKTEQNKTEQSSSIEDEPGLELPEFIDQKLWKDFLSVRRKLKAVNSDRAINALINKLTHIESMRTGQANAEIERSIINSWKSIYEPDDLKAKDNEEHYPF